MTSPQEGPDEAPLPTGPGIPPTGVLAGRTLLDAVVSQCSEVPLETNVRTLELAFGPLIDSGASAEEVIEGLIGSSVLIQSWFAHQLARQTCTDVETVVSDARAYSLGQPRSSSAGA